MYCGFKCIKAIIIEFIKEDPLLILMDCQPNRNDCKHEFNRFELLLLFMICVFVCFLLYSSQKSQSDVSFPEELSNFDGFHSWEDTTKESCFVSSIFVRILAHLKWQWLHGNHALASYVLFLLYFFVFVLLLINTCFECVLC